MLRTLFSLTGKALRSTFMATLMLVASLGLSIAMSVSSSVVSAVSGFLGSVGIRSAYDTVLLQRDTARRSAATLKIENGRLNQRIASNRQTVRRVNQRVFNRTLRSTARSVSAIAVESIPVIGVAALIGTTAWEVHDGCANLNDLHELYTAFGVEPDYPEYQQTCIAYTQRMDALRDQADGFIDWPET